MIVVSGPTILKAHADYLRAFWGSHKGLSRRHTSKSKREDVITALRQAGQFKILYSNPMLNTNKVRREKFDRVKNIRKRYRFQPKDQCLACGQHPDVRHHIIWLINGGRNNRRNICFLCNTCHAQVHPWLQNK